MGVVDGKGRHVGKLIYSAIASLDGYVEDASGSFTWAAPDDEVHAFVNDLERSVGTYLYGRRMYETMRFWEDAEVQDPGSPPASYAELWRAADKVVFSRTLAAATTARTRMERSFNADVVRELKASTQTDLSIGGADLAGQALSAGLVDRLQLLLVPTLVGAGRPALPSGVRIDLDLVETRRFTSGVVCLKYSVNGAQGMR